MSKPLEIKSNGTWSYTRCKATGFDEVGILEKMGRDSWELVGLGPFYLDFRRPVDSDLATPWGYHRYMGLKQGKERSKRLAEGWELAGQWRPFLYFKRPQP